MNLKTIEELHEIEMKILAKKHEYQAKRETFVFAVVGILVAIALAL